MSGNVIAVFDINIRLCINLYTHTCCDINGGKTDTHHIFIAVPRLKSTMLSIKFLCMRMNFQKLVLTMLVICPF